MSGWSDIINPKPRSFVAPPKEGTSRKRWSREQTNHLVRRLLMAVRIEASGGEGTMTTSDVVRAIREAEAFLARPTANPEPRGEET